MQDRPPGIFVVATANDDVALPPEFLRKGRFDDYDLDALARASEGFSGAEIEAAVVGALYRAYAAGSELTMEEILAEARSTVPLSTTRGEEISRLRAWAEQRCVPV
ncbi:MAG: hypothetical protein ACRDHO_07800 [Actinomycetota bacterium]